MTDEQLIDLVKQYDIIYNAESDTYRDGLLRNAAWEKIATLHGKPVEDCKENWNKLRNCYNNAMKRRQKKSPSGKTFAPWRYEERMSFLKPYLKSRNVSEEMDLTTTFKESPAASPESFMSNESNPFADAARPLTPSSNASHKRKASFTGDSYLADMMGGSKVMREDTYQFDEMDHFFLSMSKTVKRLPRLDQIRIKLDLHKAVSEAELKQLESQENKLNIRVQVNQQPW